MNLVGTIILVLWLLPSATFSFAADSIIVWDSGNWDEKNWAFTILDFDGDGTPNDSDAFPLDPTEWLDTDNDTLGNNADWDDDNDGVPDGVDAAPLDNGNTAEISLPLDGVYKGGKLGSGVLAQ